MGVHRAVADQQDSAAEEEEEEGEGGGGAQRVYSVTVKLMGRISKDKINKHDIKRMSSFPHQQ